MHKELKSSLYTYYIKNKDLGRKHIIDKFKDLGVPLNTLNRWFILLEQGNNLERKIGSGLKAIKGTSTLVKKLKSHFNHKKGRSQRKFAYRHNISQSYVSKLLKRRTRIRTYKRSAKPLVTATQIRAARPKCRRLYFKYSEVDFLLDDESYFTLRNTNLAGNDRYYSDNI